jgi:hypothetical protein
MANPNIVNVTSIYGETAVLTATTANANVVQNSSASGKVYKINSLFVSNLSTEIIDINIDLIRLANNFAIIRNVSVPSASTIVPITKDSSIYLVEGDALQASSSANSNVHVICSYEVIS